MLKKKYVSLKEQGIGKELFLVFLTSLLLSWTLFIGTPFDIVASNAKEFTYVPGSSIFWNGIFYGGCALIGLMILYGLSAAIFRKGVRRFIVFLLITISLFVWVNITFLTGSYGEFDGRDNIHISTFGLLNWIQVVAFLIIAVLVIFFRNRTRILFYIVGGVLFVSLATGAIKIVSKLSEKQLDSSSESAFFTYSKTNPNLLIILLDEYQSDFFEQILDEKLKNELKGFIWFRDAASNFPTTEPSVPAMFTGEIYDNSLKFGEFFDKVSEASVANQFQAKGGRVSYTAGSALGGKLFPKGSLTKFSEIDPKYLTTYGQLFNYALFRAMPDMLKQKIYRNEMWLVHFNSADELGSLGDIGKSFKLLDYIENSKFFAADVSSTFKFHHSFVTHAPTLFGAKCELLGKVPSNLENKTAEGVCAMSKVLNIINKLKKIKVFDNTMIIVVADHGSNYQPPTFNRNFPYGRAAPTLLIKPLYDNQPFQISDYPAQLSDMPKTIAKAFDISREYPGVDLLGENKPNREVRLFTHYPWEHSDFQKGYLRSPMQFFIEGALRDPNGWRSPFGCNGKIDFTKEAQTRYYKASGFSGYESVGRWSDGKELNIDLKVKPNCKAQSVEFNLRGFVTDKNPEQTASVFVNNQPVGDIRFGLKDMGQPKKFAFSLPEPKGDTYSIRFKFDKPTSPESLGLNEDPRNLGFLFVGMELISKDAKPK